MTFSQKSIEKLNTCDPRLQGIMRKAIRASKIDFGISCGYRSPEDQLKAFNEGKSKIQAGGKHNVSLALAVDIFGYVNGKADYSVPVMCYLAGIIQACAFELNIPIRWGGNWNGDGEILTDQSFDDLPHTELI